MCAVLEDRVLFLLERQLDWEHGLRLVERDHADRLTAAQVPKHSRMSHALTHTTVCAQVEGALKTLVHACTFRCIIEALLLFVRMSRARPTRALNGCVRSGAITVGVDGGGRTVDFRCRGSGRSEVVRFSRSMPIFATLRSSYLLRLSKDLVRWHARRRVLEQQPGRLVLGGLALLSLPHLGQLDPVQVSEVIVELLVAVPVKLSLPRILGALSSHATAVLSRCLMIRIYVAHRRCC